MTPERLEAAIAEAKRFLQCAKVLQGEYRADLFYTGRHAAAVRRSSMDLTHSLADLRKPPN